MSMTVWVNVRHGETYRADQTDHSAIFALVEQLDELTERLGVTPISTFFDETDVRYNVTAEIPESDEGWPVHAAQWHDASDGLRSFSSLHTHLTANPDAIDAGVDGWSAESLLSEIADCLAKIEVAANRGLPFHLLVVM